MQDHHSNDLLYQLHFDETMIIMMVMMMSMLYIILGFCVVLLDVLTFWVLCCDIHYHFRCLVRLYPQLCYLHYLCLVAHSGVQHILCCVFACIPNVASFSGLSILELPLRCSLTFIVLDQHPLFDFYSAISLKQ